MHEGNVKWSTEAFRWKHLQTYSVVPPFTSAGLANEFRLDLFTERGMAGKIEVVSLVSKETADHKTRAFYSIA